VVVLGRRPGGVKPYGKAGAHSARLCSRKAREVRIDTDYIKLDSFLKATGMVSSGGEAKVLITCGNVLVNGEPELRRGRKLHRGDIVETADMSEAVE